MKQTVNMLCSARLLSGVSSGPSVFFLPLRLVSSNHRQRRDQDRHRTYLHGSEERQTALCAYVLECVWTWGGGKDGGCAWELVGCVTCGSGGRSWSSVPRLPAFGQKTANQQTAGKNTKKRENVLKKIKCDGRKEEDRNEMHLYIKGDIMFKVSGNRQ